MADTTTKWILEMVDKITSPAKQVDKTVEKTTEAIDAMTSAVTASEQTTMSAVGKSQKQFDKLHNQIRKVTGDTQKNDAAMTAASKSYSDLNRLIERETQHLQSLNQRLIDVGENVDPLTKAQIDFQVNGAEEKLRRLKEQLTEVTHELEELNSPSAMDLDSFSSDSGQSSSGGGSDDGGDDTKPKGGWEKTVMGINQGLELMDKATAALDFAVDVQKLQASIERMTDATGPKLDDMVARTRRVAAVYDEDADKIAQAANAMTEQIGGSFEDNLSLIEDGYKKGANINGDFIDQLREYPVFIKQLGISQSEAIALMAQAGKKGIFSDKAIDSLKEGNMALREMGKTQIDALAGINMKPEDLVGKTPFEAMKLITSKMKDMTPQARQMILTDLFKGAGEDAGLAFIEGLSDMDLDLTHLKSVEEAGAGMKGFFSDISTWAGQAFGGMAIYAQQMSPMIQMIGSAILSVMALKEVQWVQTAATKVATAWQWLWNESLLANPIGIVILAVGALVGIIAICWNKFEGFREVIFKSWEGLKLFGTFIKDWFLGYVNSVLGAVTKLGKMLYYVFTGEFEKAFAAGKEGAKDMLDVVTFGAVSANDAANKMGEGWDGAMAQGKKNSDEYTASLKKDEEAEKAPSVNNYLKQPTEKLDKTVDPTKGKGKGGKEGDGLNVGSGSGGIKNITMTLNISNHFSVGKGTDTRAIADKIVGNVNDRLRDAVINLGA